MSEPNAIERLRHGLTAVGIARTEELEEEALAAVDALYQAAKFALPCIDPNATLAVNTLAAAVRRVEEQA